MIARLTGRFPQGPLVELGPGDDAAVVRAPDGRYAATMDLLVEGRHFRTDWSSAYDVGRKAAAQNLADVVSMGARPVALVVSLVMPGDLPVDWVTGFARGLADACRHTLPWDWAMRLPLPPATLRRVIEPRPLPPDGERTDRHRSD